MKFFETPNPLELSYLERSIIRATAAPRPRRLDSNLLRPTKADGEIISAPQRRMEFFQSDPAHGLGVMKGLPLELLTGIVRELDLSSCFKFSQVNRYARQVVCSVPEFRTAATHARGFSLVLRRSGQGGRFTIVEMDCLLKQQECRECGRFAPFVYIPAAARCCADCLYNDGWSHLGWSHFGWPYNDIASLSRLARALRISPPRLRRLVPVMHTNTSSSRSRRVNLVSIQLTIDALSSVSADIDPDIVDRARNAASKGGDWRYVSTTAVPCLDRKTGNLLPLIFCRGCQGVGWEDRRPFYHSPRTLLQHFPSCYEAKRIFIMDGPGSSVINSRTLRNMGWADQEDFMLA